MALNNRSNPPPISSVAYNYSSYRAQVWGYQQPSSVLQPSNRCTCRKSRKGPLAILSNHLFLRKVMYLTSPIPPQFPGRYPENQERSARQTYISNLRMPLGRQTYVSDGSHQAASLRKRQGPDDVLSGIQPISLKHPTCISLPWQDNRFNQVAHALRQSRKETKGHTINKGQIDFSGTTIRQIRKGIVKSTISDEGYKAVMFNVTVNIRQKRGQPHTTTLTQSGVTSLKSNDASLGSVKESSQPHCNELNCSTIPQRRNPRMLIDNYAHTIR